MTTAMDDQQRTCRHCRKIQSYHPGVAKLLWEIWQERISQGTRANQSTSMFLGKKEIQKV